MPLHFANTKYVIKASIPAGGTTNYTGGAVNITFTAAESSIYKAATKGLTIIVHPVTPADVKAVGGKTIKVTANAISKDQAPKYQIKIWKTGKKQHLLM